MALRWAPALAYAVLLWWLSSQPAIDIPAGLSDKLLHAAAYALFGALLWRASSGRFLARPSKGAVTLAVGLSGLYAALDEFHQSFVPGRIASLGDTGADLAGSVGAILILGMAGGLLARRGDRARLERGRRAGGPVVRLLSRSGCRLCREAETVLRELQATIPFRLETVEVEAEEDLARRYAKEVPVVLIEGREIFKYRADPDRLRTRLFQELGEGEP